jgi:large subunit ribosomal protein L21
LLIFSNQLDILKSLIRTLLFFIKFAYFSSSARFVKHINLLKSQMYAIVNIKGKQYKISEKQKLFVPKMNNEIGSKVKFSEALMVANDDDTVKIGTPSIKMNIEATVLNHVKDDKVIVFKKKRRKGYKRTRGHRQQYTEIEINKIA